MTPSSVLRLLPCAAAAAAFVITVTGAAKVSPAALAAAQPSPSSTTGVSPEDVVANALVKLQAHLDVATRAMGADQSKALGDRLADDMEAFDDPTMIPGYTPESYRQRLMGTARLDASIVDQVLGGKFLPLAGITGLGERLIKSDVDGTWQPVAIYVPAQLKPDPSLVVLLHGNPQTESDMLAPPYFQALADATNSIIAAPWGRGAYDFAGVATEDVYQAADAVAKAYGIDARRIYLAGYSMGGFSVFKIGPTHGAVWHAVLCIAGSILNSETASVLGVWRHTPIYVVNGKLDESIPAKYGEQTAAWLAGEGIPTGLYQQADGTHYLPTLMPSLTQAWHDMLSGVMRYTPAVSADSGDTLPGSSNAPDMGVRHTPPPRR